MKSASRLRVAMAFLFWALCVAGKGFSGEMDDPDLTRKDLKRKVDPVIMDGSLAGEVLGCPLANLRLYAFRAGVFEPIRFQVDEMTGENGDWVLAQGPLPNGDLSNATLDAWDKLVFMAEDTGDRVPASLWTNGYTRGTEIEVLDPLTDEKGWCYLLFFASNPPAVSSLPNYVNYDYNTEILEADYWHLEYIITPDGMHSTFYKAIRLNNKNEKGANFVDRLKARPTVKAALGALTFRFNEERLKSDVLAYKIGAVRTIRRVEQYGQVAGHKALRVVLDDLYSRDVVTVPVMFKMPFKPSKLGVSIVIRFGTDYNPGTTSGSTIHNSNQSQGFLVDGKMDDGEEKFNPEFDRWRLIANDRMGGAFMTRTVLTPAIRENIKITMGLIDDDTRKDPPETYPGLRGYLWQDWDVSRLPRGKYWLFLEFYGIPAWKPGDEIPYCNYLDHPLKIRVGNQEKASLPMILPELGERYKELHPEKSKR
jgi:hypothetical protein